MAPRCWLVVLIGLLLHGHLDLLWVWLVVRSASHTSHTHPWIVAARLLQRLSVEVLNMRHDMFARLRTSLPHFNNKSKETQTTRSLRTSIVHSFPFGRSADLSLARTSLLSSIVRLL